jgi:PadR family transcriptional regulator, regulatory protein PadR
VQAAHLGEFEQLLLFALLRLGDEAHGTAIASEIQARIGREVSPGAVYTALDRLAQRRFVTSRLGEGTAERGGRRRKFYRLLPEGARALRRSYGALRQMATGVAARLDALAD